MHHLGCFVLLFPLPCTETEILALQPLLIALLYLQSDDRERCEKPHVDYDFFSQWREYPWRRRGADYAELKAQITQSLIQLVERHYPGFQNLIAYAEQTCKT